MLLKSAFRALGFALLVFWQVGEVRGEGAIAYGRYPGWAFPVPAAAAYDMATEEEARQQVLARCNQEASGCYIQTKFRDTCIALIPPRGIVTSTFTGFGDTVEEAIRKAKVGCLGSCEPRLAVCDRISESPRKQKVDRRSEPTAAQAKSLEYMENVGRTALKSAAQDLVIGFCLGLFFCYVAKVGKKARSEFEPVGGHGSVLLGAIAAAALTVGIDMSQGHFLEALLGANDYWMRYGTEWLFEKFSILAIVLFLPMAIVMMAGSFGLIAVCGVGAAYAVYRILTDGVNFLRGLRVLFGG